MKKYILLIFVILYSLLNAQFLNENSITIDDVEYYMATDQYSYTQGDSVQMKYKITNFSSTSITLLFGTVQFYDFFVENDYEEIWRWSAGLAFITIPVYRIIEPGDSLYATYCWDMCDYWGNMISPGNYVATGFLAYSNHIPVSVNLEYTEVDINNQTIPNSNLDLVNFPNPFNPSTTIEFSIPNDSDIELSIFNVKGQLIKALMKNHFKKGRHSIIWNGDDEFGKPVTSGVYYQKLSVNGKTVQVNKCLMFK